MLLGVFIPIGNNGWLISTNSPQYKPSFALNKTVVQKAEGFGFDFALSMIKLHGFGGPSQFWDYNLESFTLMSGLAAVTDRIKLFATCAVLTMPPAITARMAVTIDSIAPGRFGINMVSGWQRREYAQMGLWPGSDHYNRRYEYCAEYVTIMRQLWETGHSDHKGDFFQMDDCRCLPLPSAPISIICAGQSDAGTRYAAEYADYNFCSSFGVNMPQALEAPIARLVKATAETGRHCNALVSIPVIADETDEAAFAKWEHYKDGIDLEAIAWREAQAEDARLPGGGVVGEHAHEHRVLLVGEGQRDVGHGDVGAGLGPRQREAQRHRRIDGDDGGREDVGIRGVQARTPLSGVDLALGLVLVCACGSGSGGSGGGGARRQRRQAGGASAAPAVR